ncbi:NADH-quinone oxidoreductase subunit M [Aquella oligotrophica]|uniref:NADH-quinone oxidoreductase subunit M n=1 Tax=Aquella oligotrophica TaxID=2067065 RepID=A0A2I7N4K5_9NEIS|nr:NADH-quinone oxidoreductase subunit M [Aquella oligotrophica]AUR51393.1 NADH-quinone oxidoreductase subunit M [Aquella oligotrophica]
MMNYLLSLTIWTPIVFGLITLLINKNDCLARYFALLGSIIAFLFSLLIFFGFDSSATSMQFQEMWPWVGSLNINYHLGVDGISMPFVVLNNFITVLVILAGFKVIKHKVSLYNSMFLMMTGFISGSFCALDAILFYVFFEAMLIPMYLIIGVWGSSNRVYAAIKFFLYTLIGSLLMLVALIYLYFKSNGNFEILSYYKLPLSITAQTLIFIAFFMSFAVKVPMWPLHTWLPDAHPEAPTGGSMVLAAITLKIGGYGFLRFILPIVPDASRELAGLMVVLSLIAIVYIGLVAVVQKDMKKLVAYSSISHMGFVTLGCFLFANGTLNTWAVEGAITQMISHGFVSAAMFFCIGVMYDRVHSRNIADYGGVVNKMPVFAAFFMLFAMANSGLPGTSGFAGEFMVIMGAVETNFVAAILAGLTLILGAGYTLWMYKRVVFGDVVNSHVAEMDDVSKREFLILAILAIAVIVMGVCPNIFVAKMHASVEQLLTQVTLSKI